MNPILDKLDALRASLRRLALTRGLAVTLGVLLASGLLVGWLDFEFRWDAPWARWIAWGGVLLLTAASTSVMALWPLLTPISRLQVALRIERAEPAWEGELAAYVALADEGPAAGAAPVVERTCRTLQDRLSSQIDRLEESALLDDRLARTLWAMAGGLLAAGFMCLTLRPVDTVIAATRLCCPWSLVEWPRETRLEVYDGQFRRLSPAEPLRAVADQPLTILFRDAEGNPPSRVELMIHDGERTRVEYLSAVQRSDSKGREYDVFAATLFPDQSQLYFRASAGDDDTMRWYSVTGSSPPRVVSASAELVPPSFTGRNPQILDPLPPRLTGLPGTQVEIHGRLDQPVRQASMHVGNDPPHKLALDLSRTQFTATLEPSAAGRIEFWFTFTDAGGLRDPDPPRYEFLAVEDRLPEIRFGEPAGDVRVTPSAVLPVKVVGTDDYGVGAILVTLASDGDSAVRQIASCEAETADQTKLLLEADVPIGDLSLAPGRRLTLQASVSDRHPGDGRTQRSQPLTVIVVSEEEKRRELAGRLAGIADGLLRAAEQQNGVLESVRQLQIQQSEAGQLRRQDVDLLRAVEERQREVRTATGSSERSVRTDIADILRQYQTNRLDDRQTTTRLASLLEELDLLHEGRLASVEEHLAEALRRLPTRPTAARQEGFAPIPQLAEIEFDLRAAAKTLNDLAVSVDEWRRRNDLTGELDRLIAAFQKLHRDTIRTGQRTIASSISSLAPQDRAELAKLSERQRQISADVETLANAFRAAGAAHPYFADAAKRLEQQRLSSIIEEGALQLQRNNIGQAVTIQTQAAEMLAAVSQIVKGNSLRTVESLLKQVSEAESLVETFRGRESSLERRWKEIQALSAASNRKEMLDVLVKQHEALSLDAAELARQLRLSGLDAPPTLLDQAALRIRQTRELLPRGSAPQIEEGYRNSAELLTRAGEELARVRKNLAWEAAAEELWSIGSLARSLADRQQSLEREVRRLQGLRLDNQHLTRAELRTLQLTASAQLALSADVQPLTAKVDQESLLRETISEIAGSMEDIARQLERRNTSSEVSDRQRETALRLREVGDAIEAALGGGTQPPSEPMAGSQQTEVSPQSLDKVADLKLLLSEQRRLRSRTEEVLNLPSDDPQRQDRIRQLAQRQQRLTDWLARLLPQAETSN